MKSVEDFSDIELIEELTRRRECRESGHCDYCGRRGDQDACQQKQRHEQARVMLLVRRNKTLTDDVW